MKRYGQWLITIVLCLTALLIMGCGSTFLISKDCKTYYFGEVNGTTYEMLCLSGDIELILEGTSLPPETRVAIYRSTCADPSKAEVQAIYATLSAAQKKDLRFSFQKQGYEVNTKTIGNFRYEPLATSPGFCFPD